MPGLTVDGNDALAVHEAVSQAVARARHGEGPSFVEGLTYRYRGHYEGDPQVYRSREEVAQWEARDPIQRMRDVLRAQGVSEHRIAALERAVAAQVEEAVDFARSAPPVRIEDAQVGVYGDTHDDMVF
jgi:pyruvate dehydrogenase E1 component alpha subunit